MHYVGVDYHKKSSYVTVMDERGKVVKEGQIANTREALTALLDGTAESPSAVLEAGRNWPVMYDWLDELVDKVTLAHPAKVRVIAEAKVKTDRIDSRMLAHLLRAELIPAAYAPGAVTREQRRRLRQRMFLVRLSTMVKNRVHTLVDRHPELSRQAGGWSDLFGKLETPDRKHSFVDVQITNGCLGAGKEVKRTDSRRKGFMPDGSVPEAQALIHA